MTAQDLVSIAEGVVGALDLYGECNYNPTRKEGESCREKVVKAAMDRCKRSGRPFTLRQVTERDMCHWCEAWFLAYRLVGVVELMAQCERRANERPAGKAVSS